MTQDNTHDNKIAITNVGNTAGEVQATSAGTIGVAGITDTQSLQRDTFGKTALQEPTKVDTSYQGSPATAVVQPTKGVVAKTDLVRPTGSKARAQDKIVEVVEVLEDNKYHVKNVNPPHDSFIVYASDIKDE